MRLILMFVLRFAGEIRNLNQFFAIVKKKDGKFSIECTLHKISIKIALYTSFMLHFGWELYVLAALMAVCTEWQSNEKYLCFYLYFLLFFITTCSHFSFARSVRSLCAPNANEEVEIYLVRSFTLCTCTLYSGCAVRLLFPSALYTLYHYFLIMIVISCSWANRRSW